MVKDTVIVVDDYLNTIVTWLSRGLKIRKFHFFNFESSEKISPRRIEIMIGRNEGSGVKVTISGHVIELVSRDKVGSCDLGRDQILNSWTFMKYKHLVFLFEKDVNQSYEHLYEFQSSETQFMNAVQILKHPKIISLAISSTIND